MAILVALPVTIPFGLLSLILFRFADGHLRDVWPVHAGRDRQEERDLASRQDQPATAQGMSRDAAIIEANHTRLRPILMTTAMLVAAMIPIALGQGPGAGARASMAKVIIGGQMLSLLLALLVTPVTYSLLDSFTRLFRRKESRPAVAELVTADSAGERTGGMHWPQGGSLVLPCAAGPAGAMAVGPQTRRRELAAYAAVN